MGDDTSGRTVSQVPRDYIDFAVSDTFRDHYAAQGLTYPSGRREKNHLKDQQLTEAPAEVTAMINSFMGAIRQLTKELRRSRITDTSYISGKDPVGSKQAVPVLFVE